MIVQKSSSVDGDMSFCNSVSKVSVPVAACPVRAVCLSLKSGTFID